MKKVKKGPQKKMISRAYDFTRGRYGTDWLGHRSLSGTIDALGSRLCVVTPAGVLPSVGNDEDHPTWDHSQMPVGSAGTRDRTLGDAPGGRRMDPERPSRHRGVGHRDTGVRCHQARRDTRRPIPYTRPRRYRIRSLRRSQRSPVETRRQRGQGLSRTTCFIILMACCKVLEGDTR
jgi:hypothetical protein